MEIPLFYLILHNCIVFIMYYVYITARYIRTNLLLNSTILFHWIYFITFNSIELIIHRD